MTAENDTALTERSLSEIAAAIRTSDYERAKAVADAGIAKGLEHPVFYNARGLAHRAKGQFREALTEFSRARELAPQDSNVVSAVGTCLSMLNRPMDAIRTFDEAIALNPNNANAHFRKGWILEMLGDRDAGQKAYERVIAIDPNHAEALGSLASALAGKGEYEKARSLAERALKLAPNQPTAMAAMGVIEIAERKFSAAETRFRRVLETPDLTLRARAGIHGRLGDALDGLDRADEAFAAYKFEKNEIYKLYAQNYLGRQRPQETADRIRSFVERAPADSWTPVPETDQSALRAKGHVFLVGFSRSGTTLLEQVLATHPEVAALEEQDLLAESAQTFLASDAGLQRLASAQASQELAASRQAYWQRVRDLGLGVEGKVFVDKLPLNTVKLPLIARLFPDAKILFALRDPRDVILSCYRRHFEVNAAMFEFLTLDDATELYSSVMQLALVCREKLPLRVHELRYEEMVADFDKTIAAVCEFIGVEWLDALRQFHKHDVLAVRSPSAIQIRRPLNPDSVGQWRRYRKHLTPILPQLMPWVERFGYPAE